MSINRILNAALCLSLLTGANACKKEPGVSGSSYIYLKYGAAADYEPMETVEGSWDAGNSLAQLSGTGQARDRLQLYLPALTDTGNVTDPGLTNIRYSDDQYFIADSFAGGFIHISAIDPDFIKGEFNVILSDVHEGAEKRHIIGTFGVARP
jgi:hypothetical protein